eukprot:CAMPEP_0119049108 /NCGR_PEP_ID=MMETSP1177-20130426/62816_1 /TAXON_ID=2985 /ORGANISM="Ochromonas sp, Strain CCMP1899" /LENGTH=477 /DNA_ID=CAMNT_0007025911 /DNA_START=291 /DNA_END=1721 /DNA_ORIENTATION=+
MIRKKTLTIALVGRPNTGKSTLFNKLTGSNNAIVSAVPGTTRDRKQEKGRLAGLPLVVMDTGGLDDRGAISIQIQDQVQLALQSADVVIFMLDSKTGVTSLDDYFAKWLRKKLGQIEKREAQKLININATISKEDLEAGAISDSVRAATISQDRSAKEIIVVANKTEGAHLSAKVLDCLGDALKLGLGDPIPISATHGEGMADLAQILLEIARKKGYNDGDEVQIKHTGPIPLEDRTIQLAVMGRPNVGKSSLINAFLGEDRMITGETPGLTRDAVHVEWVFNNRTIRLVDTAGLTRIRTDKALLDSKVDIKKRRIQDTTGRQRIQRRPGPGTYSKVALPGLEGMDPECDPSQFSHQVSELALASALKALRYAQVVLIVIENKQGKFSKLDLQLARKCLDEGRAVVIAANKGDLAQAMGVGPRQYEEGVKKHTEAFMKELGDIPVIATVATEGKGINRLLSTVLRVHDSWSNRISTW